MRTNRTFPGMTLLEVLVVITIITTLGALLLPAIQASREAARITQCKSNLREIAVGLISYTTYKNRLPVGCLGGPKSLHQHSISWNVQLLPFIELSVLQESFDFGTAAYSVGNRSTSHTIIEQFLCPGTPEDTLYQPSGLWRGAAFTDYGGIYGVEGLRRDTTSWEEKQFLRHDSLGVMLFDEAVNLQSITDGLSKTACVAERMLRRVWDTEWANGRNIFSQQQSNPINSRGLGNEIGSPHPGGAMLAFCDGHVEFVDESIDQPALNALLTKAGGDGR